MGSIVEGLEAVLRPDQVSADEAVLARYAVDQAPVLDFHLPLAVVLAESVEDVQAVVRCCAARRTALVARGAGTGVSGGAHALSLIQSDAADE
jgi:glycolate oxidase